MKRFGIIVDGYSTGAGLAKEFLKHNISCVHVQSQPIIPKVYRHTFIPDDYQANFIFQKNLNTILNNLNIYSPLFAIAGSECGIQLADTIAEELNLKGNGTKLSLCRRNKFHMMKQIQSKGIQYIPTFKTDTLHKATGWALKKNFWPYIVKPVNSAGGEDVKICYSTEDIILAFSNIISKKLNMFGLENHEVIIQPYTEGDEFVVNTVSCNGKHKLCEIWEYKRYKKSNGYQIYSQAMLTPFNKDKHSEVINYTMKVLDALSIKYGPAHVEIIKNDSGCYLIELGARLMGANLPFALLEKCVTTPQAINTINLFSDEPGFEKKSSEKYDIIKHIVALFMISDIEGQVSKINHLEKIKSLSSFFDMKLALKEGDLIKETNDYQTSPGMIYLYHSDPSVINSDIEKIRELEKTMFVLEERSATKEFY